MRMRTWKIQNLHVPTPHWIEGDWFAEQFHCKHGFSLTKWDTSIRIKSMNKYFGILKAIRHPPPFTRRSLTRSLSFWGRATTVSMAPWGATCALPPWNRSFVLAFDFFLKTPSISCNTVGVLLAKLCTCNSFFNFDPGNQKR